MRTILTGDQYVNIDRKLAEIKRQMLQPDGYPFDPEELNAFLQRAVEGKWHERWFEKDGIIYFTLVSNGMTGEEWITHFEGKGFPVNKYVKGVLRHRDFKPTKVGTSHCIAVIKGECISNTCSSITSEIRTYAKSQKKSNLPAEVACLIVDNFTAKEINQMGLESIVTMHEPIDSGNYSNVLGTGRNCNRLEAYDGDASSGWICATGFAFATEKAFVA